MKAKKDMKKWSATLITRYLNLTLKKINPGIACLNDRKLVFFFKICLPAENVFLIQESSNEVLVEPKNCPKTKNSPFLLYLLFYFLLKRRGKRAC